MFPNAKNKIQITLESASEYVQLLARLDIGFEKDWRFMLYASERSYAYDSGIDYISVRGPSENRPEVCFIIKPSDEEGKWTVSHGWYLYRRSEPERAPLRVDTGQLDPFEDPAKMVTALESLRTKELQNDWFCEVCESPIEPGGRVVHGAYDSLAHKNCIRSKAIDDFKSEGKL